MFQNESIDTLKEWISDRSKWYFFSFLTLISLKINIHVEYFFLFKERLDINNPHSFVDKLAWMKINIFPLDERIKRCSDKYLVRDYVRACGFQSILTQIYCVSTDIENIDFNDLPNSFVLKCSNGWNNNYIVNNKEVEDIKGLKKKCKKWIKNKYYLRHAEYQYKNTLRFVYAEEMLLPSDGKLLDYKFYCFNGSVRAILVLQKDDEVETRGAMMSREWSIISKLEYRYKNCIYPDKPDNYEKMIHIVEQLSKPFDFVRIDMYSFDSRIVFGEMTFCPNAGLRPSEALIDGKSMGELFEINHDNKAK